MSSLERPRRRDHNVPSLRRGCVTGLFLLRTKTTSHFCSELLAQYYGVHWYTVISQPGLCAVNEPRA